MNKSLPEKIANSISADYIETGLLSPGDRLPTVREFQKQYGRSNSIIVHALGLLESRRVIYKGPDGGCYVAEDSQPLEKRPPRMIGHVLPAMTEPSFVMRIHTGIERACQEFDYQLISASANQDYEIEEQQVTRLMDAGCEAIIITPIIRTRKQLRQDYLKQIPNSYPIVLVDVAYPEQKHTQVIMDNFRAGYEMTKMLIREGHQRIAFMETSSAHGEIMHKSNRERCEGYLKALRSAGIVPRPEDRWCSTAWYSQKEDVITAEMGDYLRKWKKSKDRPTAIIALEDLVAMQITLLARDLNISIPNDLRVTGFDDLDLANRLGATFPTTSPDMVLAGEVAVNLAVQQLEGRVTEPVTYVLPVPVKLRAPMMEGR
ncbi:MAG: substrate-binding domain-containing protein [Armatimonadota bacterium]|nr:substrate-binding domain-containing protein [bacterium]